MKNVRKKKFFKLHEVAEMIAPHRFKKFATEVRIEFSKIVWPNKKIAIASTGFVILLVIVFSIYLGTIDFILGHIVSGLLK